MKKIEAPAEKMRRLGLTRREWVQRMLAGAGLAGPVLGGADAIIASPASDSTAAQSQAATAWKPAFFDDHQNQTIAALAEGIVPGSTAVQANRFLDLALDAETTDIQQKFVSSLNAMEGESLRRFAKSFIDISTGQQDEILTAASTGQSFRPILNEDEPIENGSQVGPPVHNLRDYFDYLKNWISMAYYSTEAGMKELGWTGENYFESLPVCQHSDDHS